VKKSPQSPGKSKEEILALRRYSWVTAAEEGVLLLLAGRRSATVCRVLAVAGLTFFSLTANAQGLGGLGGLGGLPDVRLPPPVNRPLEPVERTLEATTGALSGVVDVAGRPSQPELLENDALGNRVVRSEVLALSPTTESLTIARALDFQVIRQMTLDALGLQITVLRPPPGLSASDAVAALRRADPQGSYDFNHIYDPSAGLFGGARSLFRRSQRADARGISVGLIDAGIDRTHPALRRANIVSENFAGPERSPASQHGTAVASLLVGESASVKGVLPGATLYAADVFGGKGAGGSAEALARGLAWVAERGAAVINVSLVGPENRTLKAVIEALLARGHVIVAAVGNDGPARPVGYPAAYEGVVAVTSVDIERRIQVDANRGPEIAFAALGVDVSVASLDKTYDMATGTSFAAPLVAARFALKMARPDVAASLRAQQDLRNEAVDLGAPGRDEVFGFGFIDAQPAGVINASASAQPSSP
jgi:hypothetical protein